CAVMAVVCGVILGVESTGWDGGSDFDDGPKMRQIINGLGAPLLVAVFDIAHAVIQGLDLRQSIRDLGDLIGHVHIHDNKGQTDDHLALGAGTIRFETAYAALLEIGYDRSFTLELESLNRGYTADILIENRDSILRGMGRHDATRE
ncbi:MAG: sugar phosphate isomerase/epimerase, partial [Spirochaetota bacterium]